MKTLRRRSLAICLLCVPSLVLFVVLSPLAALSATSSPVCTAADDPPRHHLLAIDFSGSVKRYVEAMKAFVARYVHRCARPGDEITLFTFSQDHAATVQERLKITIPSDGDITPLFKVLEDLALQDPKNTTTLFAPLAERLNAELRHVRKEPVLIILSDGKSDQPKVDLPFASLAGRGIYSVEGMKGWMVAVHSKADMDLSAVFTGEPLRLPRLDGGRVHTAAIEECLVDPELRVETGGEITLHPSWWPPFNRRVEGVLQLMIHYPCVVSRPQSFSVQLWHGGEPVTLSDETILR